MDTSLDEAKLADFAEQLREREREKEALNREEQAWRASEEKYRARQREEHRKAWASFHLDQAQRLEDAAIQLASEHRSLAQELLEEPQA